MSIAIITATKGLGEICAAKLLLSVNCPQVLVQLVLGGKCFRSAAASDYSADKALVCRAGLAAGPSLIT